MEAETRAAFLLAFELVELLGRQECNDITSDERALLRLLTPIAKLLTAKQAVAVVSEAIEAFGGAGYVEDTGLPALLRDTQGFAYLGGHDERAGARRIAAWRLKLRPLLPCSSASRAVAAASASRALRIWRSVRQWQSPTSGNG